MSQRKKATIWVIVLSIICGLIILHVIRWHSNGMYLEMRQWLQSGKAYLTVLYNLGLMLASGLLLGFLLEKITGLFGYFDKEQK